MAEKLIQANEGIDVKMRSHGAIQANFIRTVSKHATAESCWIALYGSVYDVTSFLSSHPGGSKAILRLAGRDATEEYDPIHPLGTLEETL